MSLKYTYDGAARLLLVKVSGFLDTEDLDAAVAEIATDKAIPKATDTIWDLDDCDFGSTAQVQIELAIDHGSESAVRQATKMALVAGGDLGFGMCRMYQSKKAARGESAAGSIHVARTVQDAIDWLLGQRD